MPEFRPNPEQLVAIALFVAIGLFEILFPFREYFGRIKHFGKNVVFALINSVVTGLAAMGMNIWVFVWIEENRVGLLNLFEVPFWVMALLASLLFDMWIYWWHRINHAIPFLWRFHQVHHNDTEMDMSTALRFHPGEIFLSSVVNVFAFAVLGIAIEYIVIYKLVFTINVLFHHSNVAIPERWDRWFRYILVSPNMHRVHHSNRSRETNSNYSSVLTIWDRLFGSYFEKAPSEITFGLEYDRSKDCQTLPYLLKRPFASKGDSRMDSDSEEG